MQNEKCKMKNAKCELNVRFEPHGCQRRIADKVFGLLLTNYHLNNYLF